MYGLPQVGIFGNKPLAENIDKYGYHHTKHTNGLLRHDIKPIQLYLVEYFEVK